MSAFDPKRTHDIGRCGNAFEADAQLLSCGSRAAGEQPMCITGCARMSYY